MRAGMPVSATYRPRLAHNTPQRRVQYAVYGSCGAGGAWVLASDASHQHAPRSARANPSFPIPSNIDVIMLDSSARLTGLLCGTQPMNDIWAPRATLQRMLDVEAALARASAAHQVIPQSAVPAIEAACQADQLDADALARDAALGGNLAIPLVKQLTARVKAADAEAAKYVHWGATSQDIIDTATVLQLRDTFDLLDTSLQSTCDAVRETRGRPSRDADDRPHLVAAGAADHARPEVRAMARRADASSRASRCAARARAGAAVRRRGGHAREPARHGAARRAVARATNSASPCPTLPWHTQRDRIAEAAALFGMLIGTLGKIARDISLSMQTEVGELAEPAAAGKGGSSTMPHKRNPVGCAAVLTAATRAPGLVATVFAGHGAGARARARRLAGRVGSAAGPRAPRGRRARADRRRSCRTSNVNVPRLAANLDVTRGLILGEAVMLALGDRIGRLDAHNWSSARRKPRSRERKRCSTCSSADATVTQHLSRTS